MSTRGVLFLGLSFLAVMNPCKGQTNLINDSFSATINPFFDRKHLQSGKVEYSRFSADQAGKTTEMKFQLVFDAERSFEKSVFPQGKEDPTVPTVRIYTGSVMIIGSGNAWVMRKREDIKAEAGEPLRVEYDPLFVLEDVFFKDGTVPCSKANVISSESEGAVRRYHFQSPDKLSKATWSLRDSNGLLVPAKYSVSTAAGDLSLEYEYEGWKRYNDGTWFPTAMIRRDFQSAKGKLPFQFRYVFHRFEPNVPIHCKWFLPQLPINAFIIDQTLNPPLTEPPLESSFSE